MREVDAEYCVYSPFSSSGTWGKIRLQGPLLDSHSRWVEVHCPLINVNWKQTEKFVLLKEEVNGAGCLVPKDGINLLFLISSFFMLGKDSYALALMLGPGWGVVQLTATVFRLLLGYSGVLVTTLLKLVLNRKTEVPSVITLCITAKAYFVIVQLQLPKEKVW